MTTHARNRLNSFALAMAFCAIVLRALLPAGWMPAQSLAGGTWLEICNGMAPDADKPDAMADMPAMPDMPGMAHHPHAPDFNIHDICPFAAAATLAAPGPDIAASLPAQRIALVEPVAASAQPRPARLVLASAPRGPPQMV